MDDDFTLEVLAEGEWVPGHKFHLQDTHPTHAAAVKLISSCHGKRATIQVHGRYVDVWDPAFAGGVTRYRIR